MRDSLTVLLAVQNVQATLECHVVQVLEVLPELTTDLEVLIVDNCSHDGTEEVCCELATRFTQVDYLRHPFRLGMDDSLQIALSAASGDYVLISDSNGPAAIEEMVAVWRRRNELDRMHDLPDPALGRIKTEPRWLTKLIEWGMAVESGSSLEPTGSMPQLLRRRQAIALVDGNSLRSDPGHQPRGGEDRRLLSESLQGKRPETTGAIARTRRLGRGAICSVPSIG